MLRGRLPTTAPIGIDFARSGIKLLQLREQSRKLQVVGARRVPMRLDEFDAMPPERAAVLIGEALTAGGFHGKRCVVAAPRSEVRIQSIRLPSMPDDDLRRAVQWEAAQRFDLDAQSIETDYIRTGATLQSGDARDELILLAADRADLDRRLEAVLQAGLRPDAVEPGFCAAARLYSQRCRRESDRAMVRVIAEVGASGSTILVLRGDQIAFVKALSGSGDELNRAVEQHLRLEPRAAGEIRAARIASTRRDADAEPDDPAIDRAVFEAVRPRLCDLAKEVVLCLRYYGVTFRGHPPEMLILTGGDGLEPRLDRILQQSCEMPIAFDDPAGTLQVINRALAERAADDLGPGAAWAVAAGASLRGLMAGRRGADVTARRGVA